LAVALWLGLVGSHAAALYAQQPAASRESRPQVDKGANTKTSSASSARHAAERPLEILHFDVGQGDAALITTPEGKHVLIDGGPSSDVVADLLWNMGVDTVDLVVSSHNHADHINGLPEVFYAFPVRAYLENGVPATTAVYARLLSRVEQEPGIQVLRPTARTISLGSVTLILLPPPGQDVSQNNNSVGIELDYGRFRELLTGDSEQAELSQWLAEGRARPVTVVKVAHHGSWNGTTLAWVQATQPAVAVISVGTDNKYGHPSAEVERLWAISAKVYRTDRDGSVMITGMSDGKYSVQTHASPPPPMH
jgi:competence protein ComEC